MKDKIKLNNIFHDKSTNKWYMELGKEFGSIEVEISESTAKYIIREFSNEEIGKDYFVF